MASSFFNAAQKTSIDALFDDMHVTFQKDVYVFIEESTSVGSDVGYNSMYGRTEDSSRSVTDEVLTKYTIQARVRYIRWEEEEVLNDSGLPSSENVVRLKVDLAGYELLKNSTTVEVDGERYSLIADPRIVGPFANNYYRCYLRRDT